MAKAVGQYTISEVHDGRSLSYTEYFYKATQNQVQPDPSSITDTSIPTLSNTNKYLWQKQVIHYNNSMLPQNYTRLDYIANSGTQHIDTGFLPDYSKDIEIEIEFTPTVSDTRYALLSNYSSDAHLSLELYANQGRAYFNNGAIDKRTGTLSTENINKYIFKYNKEDQKYTLTVNGSSIEGNMSALGLTSNRNLTMFVDNDKRYSIFQNALKMYSVIITEDGKVVKNLIPCKRNSDNAIGMFDIVSSTFNENQGTGTFTAGNEIKQDVVELVQLIAVCGDDGTNAIQTFLTNENHTLPADSEGNITSYAGAVTSIYVYEGATDVTNQYTITKSDSSGITSTLSGNTVTVTNVSNGTGGTITITATKGSSVLTKVFTLSVSRAGSSGKGIASITEYYLASSKSSGVTTDDQGWTEEVQPISGSSEIKEISGKNIHVNDAIDTITEGVELLSYTNNGDLIIPDEYQQVEYIRSENGYCYIDTGYKPTNNTRVEVDASVSNVSGSGRFIFGTRNEQRDDYFTGLIWTDNKVSGGYGTLPSVWQSEVVQPVNERFNIVLDKNKLYHNGVLLKTFDDSTFTCTYNMLLFTSNTSGVPDGQYLRGNIYMCKVYESGRPIRNFVPCYRKSDNVIGMYDVLHDVFYTNLGTGTFTKGDDIITPNTYYPRNIESLTGDNEIRFCNKNLWNPDLPLLLQAEGCTVTPNNDGGINIKIAGGSAHLAYAIYDLGPLKYFEGKKVTLSIGNDPEYKLRYNALIVADDYGGHRQDLGSITTLKNKVTVNIGNNYTQTRLCARLYIADEEPGSEHSINKVQVEIGEDATEYVPGVQQIRNVNLGTRNIVSNINLGAFNYADGVYSNNITDTRDFFFCMVRTLKSTGLYDVVEGNFEAIYIEKDKPLNRIYYTTITTAPEAKYMGFGHNGTTSNFYMTVAEIKPNTTYTVSFKILKNDPTSIGGVQITDLKIEEGTRVNAASVNDSDPIELNALDDVYNDELRVSTGKNLFNGKYGAGVSGLNAGSNLTDTDLNLSLDSPAGNNFITIGGYFKTGTYTLSIHDVGTYVSFNRLAIAGNLCKFYYDHIRNSFTWTQNIDGYTYFGLERDADESSYSDIQFTDKLLIQIEEGSYVTDWEPSGEGIYYIKRNTCKLLFDGNESWGMHSSGNYETNPYFFNTPGERFHQYEPYPVSNYFTGANITTTTKYKIQHTGYQILIQPSNGINTTSAFTDWINNHNVTAVVSLEKPKYEIVTNKNVIKQLNDLNKVNMFAGVTNILCSSPILLKYMSVYKKYLWNYSETTYSDGSVVESEPRIIGVAGDNAQQGDFIVSTTVEYQQGDSGTDAPTGDWSKEVPAVQESKYLWTRTTIKYKIAEDSVSYSVSKIGEQGFSIVASVTRNNFIDDEWNAYGTIGHSEVWNNTSDIRNGCRIGDLFTVVGTSTDGGKAHTLIYRSTTDSGNLLGVCIAHNYSDKGTSVESITEQYYLSTSKTTQTGGSWVETPPAWINGKYIWTRSKIVYSNPSSTVYTTPVCSSEWEAANEVQAGITDKENNFNFKYHLNLTIYGESNKFYPVIIKYGDQDVKRTILVKRNYSEQAPVDWNTATHKGSLTLKILTNFGGWGGSTYSWEIPEFQEQYSDIFGGAQNVVTQTAFCIFLRGGGETGALYHFYSDQQIDKPGSYDWDWDEDQQKYISGKIPSPQIAYNSERYFGYSNDGGQTLQYSYNAPAPRDMVVNGTIEAGGPRYRRSASQNEEIRIRQYVKLSQDNDTILKTAIDNVDVEYALSTSPTTAPSSGWSTTAPAYEDGKYMWQRTATSLIGSSSKVYSNPTCIAGATGRGISSITEEFYLSTSKVAPTGGTWVTTAPTWSSGKYIWTRSKIVYTNPSGTEYTTELCDSSWEAVNEINVGGRNLVLLTSEGQTKTGNNTSNQCTSLYNLSEYARTIMFDAIYKDGYTVTISFDWSTTAESGSFRVQTDGPIWTDYTGAIDVSESNSGHFTKTTFAKYTDIRDSFSRSLQLRMDYIIGTVSIKNLKLEFGNVATDWTPAPEDTDTAIQGVTNYIDQNIENLQHQIDGAIQFWNGQSIPTLNNYPANQWTTEDERTNHIADIYTVIIDEQGELKQGKGYRFDKVNGNWVWVEITDQEMSAVQALAASKAKVFVTTPVPPYSIGDLWLKDGELYKCKTSKDSSGSYALADWEVATDYTDDTKANAVENQLNNLSIGGRNYLYNSDFEKGIGVDSYWTKSSVDVNIDESMKYNGVKSVKILTSGNTENMYRNISQDLTSRLIPGETYTVSAYVFTDDLSAFDLGAEFRVYCERPGSIDWNTLNFKDLLVENEWVKISKTFTVASDMTKAVFNVNIIKNGRVWVSCPQVEKGNKATDWKLADEDIETRQNELMNDKISNIEIGGRNLAKNPKDFDRKSSNITLSDNLITFSTINQDTFFNINLHENLVAEQSYVLSWECAGMSDSYIGLYFPLFAQGDPLHKGIYLKNGRQHVVFSLPSDSQYVGNDYIFMDDNGGRPPESNITIKNIKLEKGNKVTDWSVAPEDEIVSLDVEYYLSNRSDALDGGAWSTTAPQWVNGKYMWSRQAVTLRGGTIIYKNQTCIAGATGSTGATGKGIASIVEQYYLSTSKTTAPSQSDPNWVTIPPTWSSGTYLWTRSKITYQNPAGEEYTTPVCSSEWEAVNEIKVNTGNLWFNGQDQKPDSSQWEGTLTEISTEDLPSSPDCTFKFSCGTITSFYVPYNKSNMYLVKAWIKKRTNYSGNSYPSIYTYDADKNLISYWHMLTSPSSVTTLSQDLNPGDTVVHATDLSSWSTVANNYECYIGFYNYKTSSGYLYDTYTRNFIKFANYGEDKTLYIDKTNNTITLKSAYTGTTIPAGTKIAQNKDGSTYIYPFGAISVQGHSEWTYHETVFSSAYDIRFSVASYIRFCGYVSDIWYSGLSLRDVTYDEAIKKTVKTVDVQYYLSNYSDSLSGGSWSTVAPAWVDGKYMWSRQVVTYVDNTTATRNETCIAGAKGATGQAGADAKLVDITPSSNVFKSTTGETGTFNPEYIYMYPTFQSCSYSKWQYTTNGTSWTDVSSGSNGLTIGTYNSIANTLRISRDSNLFNSTSTASFKCLSNNANYYDIESVIKVYDVSELEIGGRNFILNSCFLKGIVNRPSTLVPGWSIPSGNSTLNTSVKYNNHNTIRRYRTGTTEVSWTEMSYYYFREDTSTSRVDETWTLSFMLYSDNSELWDVSTNTIAAGLRVYDSTSTKTYETSFANMVTIIKANIGKWVKVKQTFTIPATSNYKYFYVFNSPSRDCDFYITDYKLERGNVATDWSLAPEDLIDADIVQSATEPSEPYEGMLWYNTTNNTLYIYNSNQWRSQDMSIYASQADLNRLNENKNKVWITVPTPPYYAGDCWNVVDYDGLPLAYRDYIGYYMTCVNSRTSGSFSMNDWITPLTAYTTVTDMTNVIGTDPTEWSSTSKSLTTLINENTSEIEGQKGQISSLAVRASGIEMSFSRTGTMNFLGNSSGQNGLKGWTISSGATNNVRAASASEAADINQSLVSLSAFRLSFSSTVKTITMTSDLFTPPTSDIITVSTKVKIPGKYTKITVSVKFYDDYAGTEDNTHIIDTISMNIPYAVSAENEFVPYHMSISKGSLSREAQRARLIITAIQDTSDGQCLTTDPDNDKGKISCAGNLYKYDNTYTYLKPVYKKLNIIKFNSSLVSQASSLKGDTIYLCETNLPEDSLSTSAYVAGTYYTIAADAQASSKVLVPITDSYTIMMLDSSRENIDDNSKAYYNITMNGTSENIETSASAFTYTPGIVYIGDIMVNGGNNVQTWTPRQDENLWGENIKFDYSGITIENIPSGYKRIIDSNSDIAYQINNSGSIVKCIWKLTQDGFITNDIKCIGTFSMGYVIDETSPNLDSTYRAVLEMKKNTGNTGVDEYFYPSS